MEIFQKAKVVKLRSIHQKYLIADDDQERVSQDRSGGRRDARWTVEIVERSPAVRFRSCYGKYLTATEQPFMMGVQGKKVLQTLPPKLDSSLEWEPILDYQSRFPVKFKTRYGQYLRANGGIPPLRNSITHDIPQRSSHQDWIRWGIDIIEVRAQAEPAPVISGPSSPNGSSPPEPSSPSKLELLSHGFARQQSRRLLEGTSTPKYEGRLIYYHVTNENGDVAEEEEGESFTFKGSGMEELKERLEEETGMEDIVVCSRNPLNGKLYPLRLHLPPNNADMHVVVLPSSAHPEQGDFTR